MPLTPSRTAPKSAEQNLDELLALHEAVPGEPEPVPIEPVAPVDPLDALRRQFKLEMVPVFDALKAKYQAYGIEMTLDTSDFLFGGRKLVMEFSLAPRSIRLEGTAVSDGIAFNEIHSAHGVAGAISSGPMLRTRLLTPERFRDFICGQLAPLVRSKLRQK